MDKSRFLDWYRQMALIRAFENSIQALTQEQGRVLGMQILATGQEAVAVGVVTALEADDVVVTNHRSHGHLLAKGADPNTLMAEIMGKDSGVNRGKSGTLHIAAPEVNVLMTSTVVGAGPPLAAGAAFAQQYRGERAITVCFFGDGAAAEGSVHEAMNLAGVWRLPVLFVCENNCWAGAQALKVHCPVGEIACRAQGYGMPGEVADGNDVEAVFTAASRLAEHCRLGNGPAFLETLTYRMRGHGEHDRQLYVDKNELAAWAERDPITRWGRTLVERNLASTDQLANMDEQAAAVVAAAVAFGDAAEYPAAEAALHHVFVDPLPGSLTGGEA